MKRESFSHRGGGECLAVFLALSLALFIGVGKGIGYAQGDGAENRLNGAFVSRLGHDLKTVITEPSRWDRNDLLVLAAVSGSGLLLLSFDREIQDWVQERRTDSSDKTSSCLRLFGDGAFLVGLSAAIYAGGEIGHDDGVRKTALLSLESLAVSSAIAWTLKIVTGRARPYTAESSASFHPFASKSRFWSFPSGHAAAAFSVATIIALQSRPAIVDALAYSLAGLVAMSRVHDNEHWASDVFIGSLLGCFVARKIADLNRPGERKTLGLGFHCQRNRQVLTLSIAF